MIETRFKDTEIGKIPEEWEVKQIKGFADVHSGKGVIRISKGCNGFPVIGGNGKIGNYSDAFNTRDSIAIGRVGALCGNVHRIKEKSWITDNALILEAIGSYKVDLDFLYFLLKTKNLNSLCVGNAQPLITGGTVLSLQMPLPPLPEQCRIADALSKVDSLIASLDKLIAKKQAIKRGAMQELLTGKKRLPGFEGEWKETSLSDLGEIVTGNTPPKADQSLYGFDYPFYKPSDLDAGFNVYKSEDSVSEKGFILSRKLPINSILITCIASIGKVGIIRKAGICNQQINAIIPNESNNPDFIYYVCISEVFQNKLKGMAGMTAVPIISKKEFSEIVVLVPSLSEQRAIAHVLSSMDAEIAALERKRDKFRQVKQGMMQDLLTGRIRLTDN